jgi:voltage-gated potassium channel
MGRGNQVEQSDAKLRRWEDRAEWPLAVVAIVFLAAYSVDVLVRPTGGWAVAVAVVTKATWVAFAVDYVTRLALARNRWRWFVRHLLDLAVIALPFLRSLRLLRLVVLVGALQKAVGDAIRGRVVAFTVAGALLLVWVASLAVLEAERDAPGSDITNLGQALWWSVATITTVGYGDVTPVTATGRGDPRRVPFPPGRHCPSDVAGVWTFSAASDSAL